MKIFRTITYFVIGFFSVPIVTPMFFQGTVVKKRVETIAQYPSRWMQMLTRDCPVFNEKHICDWVLPGTHNAATGYMTEDNVLFYGLDLDSLTPDYAKNQGLTITQQLHSGVRYFDMRTYFHNPGTPTADLYVSLLGYQPGIYCAHEYAVFNYPMASCLQEVANFVANRQELVILNFSNFFAEPTAENHEKLAELFQKIFATSLILPNGTNPTTVPFAGLITQGRVIIFYDDAPRNASTKLQALTYSDSLVVSRWHGTNKKGQGVLCQSCLKLSDII